MIHGLNRCRQANGWACGKSVIKITVLWRRDLQGFGTQSCCGHTKVGGRGRNQTLSDAVLETAALPVSYTLDIWHRLPVTIQRLCGHNVAPAKTIVRTI